MQIYSVPDGIDTPDFAESMVDGRFSMERYNERNEKLATEVKEWLTTNGYNGPLTGETVHWSVADGYAEYMVGHAPGRKPSMILIHLAFGDGYHINEIMARGLRQADIKEQIRREASIAEMFSRKKKSDAAP